MQNFTYIIHSLKPCNKCTDKKNLKKFQNIFVFFGNAEFRVIYANSLHDEYSHFHVNPAGTYTTHTADVTRAQTMNVKNLHSIGRHLLEANIYLRRHS